MTTTLDELFNQARKIEVFMPLELVSEKEGLGELDAAIQEIFKAAKEARHTEETFLPWAFAFAEAVDQRVNLLEKEMRGAGNAFLQKNMTLKEQGKVVSKTIGEARDATEEQIGHYLLHVNSLVRRSAHRAKIRFQFSPENLTEDEFLDRLGAMFEQGYFVQDKNGPIRTLKERFSFSDGQKFGFDPNKKDWLDNQDRKELTMLVKNHLHRFYNEKKEAAKAQVKTMEKEANVTPHEVLLHGAEGTFNLDVPQEDTYTSFTLLAKSEQIEVVNDQDETSLIQIIRPVKTAGGGGSLNKAAENDDIYVEINNIVGSDGAIFSAEEMPKIQAPRFMQKEEFEKWLNMTKFLQHTLRKGFSLIAETPEGEIPAWSFLVCRRKSESTLKLEGDFKWKDSEEDIVIPNLSLRWKRKGDATLELVEIVTDNEKASQIFKHLLGKSYPEKEKYEGLPAVAKIFLRLCFSQQVGSNNSR